MRTSIVRQCLVEELNHVEDLLVGAVKLRSGAHLQQAARVGGGDDLRVGRLRMTHFVGE